MVLIDASKQFYNALALNDAGQGRAALECLALAAQSGHGQAQLQLALWLLTGHNTPANPMQGFQLVQSLALAGDGLAQLFCASLAAGGTGTSQSWPRAVHWLQIAADNGQLQASNQLALLSANAMQCPPTESWVPAALPEPDIVDASINLRHYHSVFDPAICRHLSAAAEPYLHQARVNDAGAGDSTDASRNNDAMGFYSLEADVVSQWVRAQMAQAGGRPAQFAEVLSVLRYRPGERYQPHYDFFDPQYPQHQPQLAARGQRCTTVLLYLNDHYLGGHTRFCRLARNIRGQPGDLLAFDNTDANGGIDRRTLHEGTPVTQGEKWLASLWIRERPPV